MDNKTSYAKAEGPVIFFFLPPSTPFYLILFCLLNQYQLYTNTTSDVLAQFLANSDLESKCLSSLNECEDNLQWEHL